jgi:hypothetical protein
MGVDTIGVVVPGNYSVVPTEANAMIALNGANGSGTGLTMKISYGTEGKGITHAGWNKLTVGSGGRAGREHWECLVAMTMNDDGSNTDDAVLPNS